MEASLNESPCNFKYFSYKNMLNLLQVTPLRYKNLFTLAGYQWEKAGEERTHTQKQGPEPKKREEKREEGTRGGGASSTLGDRRKTTGRGGRECNAARRLLLCFIMGRKEGIRKGGREEAEDG